MNIREYQELQDAYQGVYDEIGEELKPLPKKRMERQAERAYEKETSAAAAGNEQETNKQMQRRIAMQSPGSRRTALQNKNMREETDVFTQVLEYLVAEGYADTNENALAIMANMSEEWKEEILGEGKSDRPLGIMHSFSRGMKQKKGDKGEGKYGQDSEGNITGKYTKMQNSKRST